METGSAQADATLAGAVYGIYKGAQLVDTYTTDANGQFTTDYYICDTDWTIREISSSEGYLLDSTIHKVGADPGDFTVEFNTVYNDVTEQVIKGKIAIIKHSDDGSTQIETPEEGAEFEVYLKSAGSYGDAKDTERDVLTCDENGFAQTKDLPYGVYTVHQTKGWDGTEFMSDFDVFISKDGQTYRFLINNAPYFSYVKITKVDAETGKPVTSSSAAYQIYDSNGELVTMTYTYPTPTTIDTFYTDTEGYLITPEKLPYGEYTLAEVQAPYGYVLNSELIPFTVSQDNSTTDESSGIEVISVVQSNLAQKGTVTITKVGDTFNSVTENEDGTYTPSYYEKAMEGVVFDIIAVEDIYTGDGTLRASEGDVVDTITTAADGTATCKQLYLGKYIIRETETLEGYALNTNDFAFELTYAGQEIQLVEVYKTFENELQKVEISLEKLMEQDETFGIGANSEYSSVSFGLYAAEDITAIDGSVIPAEGLIEVISIDENGYGVFKTDLPFGEYYVQEIATDNHYLMNDIKYPISFTYTGADVPVIQVKINDGEPIVNELIRGCVNGIKVDEDGEGLAGALIGLFKADETEFTTENAYVTAESAEDGSFSFDNVPYGDWVIREIVSPTGYVLNNESYEVTITEDEQVIEVEIENTQIRGGFVLYKVDADDNDVLLDGAVFELYSGDGELLDEFTVNDGQYSQNDLVYGSYYLLEKEAPDNYELSEEKYPFEITEDGAIIEITALNEKSLSGVRLVKTDATNESLTLKGAEFMLYNSENTLLGTYETDESGVIKVDGLTYGDYYFIESAAPEGYDLDDMPTHFTINQETTEGYTHYVELSVTNSETPEYVGGVRLTKTDADDENMKLEGALFGLYNSNDELIDEYSTDSDGVIEVSNLPYDDYYFIEIIAPEGYELDVTPIKFTIDADTTKDGTELVQVAATNEATPELLGGVRLVKADADDDSKKLKGAVFELHNSDDKLIDEYTTDSDGIIEVNDLPYGDYFFVETTAPEGYELDSTPIKFTIDTDTTKDGTELVEVTATNKTTPDAPEDTDTPEETDIPKETNTPSTTTTTTTDDGKGDSPKTGDETNLILPIILLIGGIGGVAVALWKRKKK
ncbi:MAG: MSCRAMM family protein [Lachnospiraceae bacterium]